MTESKIDNNKTGRGRPKKEKSNIIEIKDLKLEFNISEQDDYNNDITFLKVIDKSYKNK